MPKLRNPNTVKIFFSSPFGGMEEEREELTRRYFPQIHHLCNKHGLQFVAVDMRWGITAESSASAQVINICLREIDRSDMFVGFFGQRYGWHGDKDEVLQDNFNNAVGRYPWLADVRDRSVTELEFLHGFLNNPGHLPSTLFFRDKAYDDQMRKEGEMAGDKKQVFKYSAESELAVKKMADLKQRVWNCREKSLGVHMDYKTPAEAAGTMFDSIMKYLQEDLLADFQQTELTKRELILEQHNAFLASRCKIFVGCEEYLAKLNKQLVEGRPDPVLVTGPAGCGKSALLSNWISTIQNDTTYAVVYHFIGFAENSTDISNNLLRLVEEFNTFGAEDSDTDDDVRLEDLHRMDEGSKNRQLMGMLIVAIERVVRLGKVPVIVLDGLDKVISKTKIDKSMYWLPVEFPTSTVVVVSTTDSDTDAIEELGVRGYSRLDMQHLDHPTQREICVRTLQESGKELSTPQLERIVEAEMTKRPLFLNIVLAELVSFGYFRLLDKKIDSLIQSESIEALFEHVLVRLEEDYNVEDYDGNLVEQVMCSVCLSHQGLSETELKEMFNIPDHVWSPFYFAVEKVIVDQSGRIQFGFTELHDAVSVKYLSDPDKRSFYLKQLIEYFNIQLKKSDVPHARPGIRHRPVFELPWLWVKLGDKQGLADCLTTYLVFQELEDQDIYHLIDLYHHTGLSGQEMRDRLLVTFDNILAQLYVDMEKRHLLDSCETPGLFQEVYLRRLDRFLSELGVNEAREKVILRNIKIIEDGLRHCVVRDRRTAETTLYTVRYKLACLYCEARREKEGIQLHERLLQEMEKSFEVEPTPQQLKELGHLYHGIGVGYLSLSMFEKTIEYSTKSLECHEKSGLHDNLRDLSSSWSNLGLCHMALENLPLALHYFDKAIQAQIDVNFGHLPPVIGEMLTNLAICQRRMGNVDEAEKTYQKSLEVKVNAVGRLHPIVAMALLNLGTLEMHRDNTEKSLDYGLQAIDIYEKLGQTWTNPNYIMCLENHVANLTTLMRFEEADKLIMKLLEWRLEDGSMDASLYTIYSEMAKYYLREQQWHNGYRVMSGLLDSKHKAVPIHYLLMAYCLDGMTDEERNEVREEFRLKYGIEQHPGDVALVKLHVENELIKSGDVEEIARLINRLHDLTPDMGADVYVLSSPWCSLDGEVVEDCFLRVNQEGLTRYPDNLELLLNVAKSYRRQNEPTSALPYAVKMINQQQENWGLIFFTAQTAALAEEFEDSLKYCDMIIEKCTDPDEEMVTQAKQLYQAVVEAIEGRDKQQGEGQ